MAKPRKAEIQPSLFEAEPSQPIERPFILPNLFLGTSSFTAAGWEGSFYPIGMRQRDFLHHYSSQFQTVEIDSTFYGTPAASTVANWNERTPADFIFAVKIPQVITHEKVRVDCGPEFRAQLVFTRNGEPIKDYRRAWRNAAACGLKAGRSGGPTWHGNRRSAAVNLMDAGVDEQTTMSITGHNDATTFRKHYRVLLREAKMAAAAKLAGHLGIENTAPNGAKRNATKKTKR